MAVIGKIINGNFHQLAGNFDILNADVMTSTSTSPGLMSIEDKQKIDIACTSDDIATSEEVISAIFNKD